MIAIHPGRLLKRELRACGLSCNAIARDIRVPPGRIIDIVNGKRSISAETALRLGRYFGNGGRFWVALQLRYDLIVAEQKSGPRIVREVAKAA